MRQWSELPCSEVAGNALLSWHFRQSFCTSLLFHLLFLCHLLLVCPPVSSTALPFSSYSSPSVWFVVVAAAAVLIVLLVIVLALILAVPVVVVAVCFCCCCIFLIWQVHKSVSSTSTLYVACDVVFLLLDVQFLSYRGSSVITTDLPYPLFVLHCDLRDKCAAIICSCGV